MYRKLYPVFLLLITFFIISCNDENVQTEPTTTNNVSFEASVTNIYQTKVSGNYWENGDKIGVYALESDMSLSDLSIIDDYKNIRFSTSGSSSFKSMGTPILYPQDGSEVDFIAYYPYKNKINSFVYPIDIEEQIDLLYSSNIKYASKLNPKNTLNFKRVLSKLHINISPKSTGTLDGLEIYINGVKTKADFSLKDGSLKVDENSTKEISINASGDNKSKELNYLLLPTQEKNSIKVSFKINNSSIYEWVIPHVLESGMMYSYSIKLDKLSGTVNPSKTYMEIPYYTSGGTAPNSYKATHMVGSINWLNPSYTRSITRNYTILYDIENHIPYWIAYPMHPVYLASGNRTNDWDYDPIIPVKYQPNILNGSWANRSYNRGHMLASADRSATRAINRTTFYATNMVPQNSKMNGSTWNNLEQKVRKWCMQSSYDTLYVVTGSILPKSGQVSYTSDKHGKQVAIPKYLYKALLRQNKSTKKYYSIAFKMENRSSSSTYQNSVVSVEEIERETGFTFFPNISNLTDVKKQKNLSQWN